MYISHGGCCEHVSKILVSCKHQRIRRAVSNTTKNSLLFFQDRASQEAPTAG